MRWSFEVDGAEITVEADKDTRIVGERTLEVERINSHTALVTHEGRQHVARLASAADGVWVSIDGRAVVVRSAARKRQSRVPIDEHIVTPPMPGQVSNILVAVGDEVAKGQPLLVVTAMKLETPLLAPRAGRIGALHVTVGQQVSPGETLVEIA